MSAMEFTCEECDDFQGVSSSQVSDHVLDHHVLLCFKCGAYVSDEVDQDERDRAMDCHNYECHFLGKFDGYFFTCKKCDEKFHSQSKLDEHTNTVHNFSTNFPPINASPESIQSENVNRVNCKLCDKTYADKKGLKRHMVKIHENGGIKTQKFYNCGECDAQFSEKRTFNQHVKMHFKETTHKICHSCGFKAKIIDGKNCGKCLEENEVCKSCKRCLPNIENGCCGACMRKKSKRSMTSISAKKFFKIKKGESIRSKLPAIRLFLESKLFEMGSIKFNIVINPIYEKGEGENVKRTSPFLRAGPFPLHNMVEFVDEYIIMYLEYLLDSFEEGGSGWKLFDLNELIMEIVEYRVI